MEDTEDSVASPPQRTCFAESSAERSRVLNGVECWTQPTVGDTEKGKQRSLWTEKAKEAREREKVQKKKKKHVVDSLHRYKFKKTLHNVFFFFFFLFSVARFNRSPWARSIRMRNAHIRTRTARRKASCACVLLVKVWLKKVVTFASRQLRFSWGFLHPL